MVQSKLPSTNDFLKKSKGPVGEWVRADTQTAGRGRGSHSWISPPGNLYLSVRLPLREPLLLQSLAVALSVIEVCRRKGFDVKAKWPNDLLFQGLKLGGILCEVEEQGVIAGIGLNLTSQSLPEGAIALPGDNKPSVWATEILTVLPRHTDSSVDSASCQAAWLSHWHGRESWFQHKTEKRKGRITDISLERDMVVIETESGPWQVASSVLQEEWPQGV